MRYNSRRRWVYKFRRSYMYKFSLTDERTLIAVNEDGGETITIADEICWFKEYDNLVITLSVDKKFSTLYKICKFIKLVKLDKRITMSAEEIKIDQHINDLVAKATVCLKEYLKPEYTQEKIDYIVKKASVNLQILNKHTNKSFFLPKYITMVFDVPIIFSFTDKFEEFCSPPA